MIFEKSEIKDCWLIRRTPFIDERGYFARIYCENEFEKHGITSKFVQSSFCMNKTAKTLRGLHMQLDEVAEEKIVTCTRGKIYDVCVDVRHSSETYGKYIGVEMSEENGIGLIIPSGCAHGYLTLTDNTQLFYSITAFYTPGKSTGFRYNEPLFGIKWPLPEPYIISEQDKNWPYIRSENNL